MNATVAPLFEPFVLNGMELPNRLVMAPMTRWKSPGGIPGADVAAYYRRRAQSECGLIITEGTVVDDPVSAASSRVPQFHGRALDGWRRVVDAVHEAGGRIMPQLWHVGAMRFSAVDLPNPRLPAASPSGLYAPDKPAAGEPMSKAAIRAVIGAFARAAADARGLGCDGIEIHGAHGYLVDQFLWSALNRRTDEYGGDLAGRARFAVEVILAVRAEVGADFPLSFRFSQWKQQDYGARLAATPAELGELLGLLVDAGVDAFHCSQRRFWEPAFAGSELNLAGWAKRLTGKPAITVGSVGLDNAIDGRAPGALAADAAVTDLQALVERMQRQEFDLVAVGRGLLADPEWVRKVRSGRMSEIRPFSGDALEVLT